MAETEEPKQTTTRKRKPLSSASPGKLELKKTVEGGQVRQKFSHGRSKVVTVEVRKKRTFALDSGGKMAEIRGVVEAPDEVEVASEVPVDTSEPEASRSPARSLTDQEKAARARALLDARHHEEEEVAEAEARSVEETAAKAESAAAELLNAADEDAKLQAEQQLEAQRKAEAEEAKRREELSLISGATAAAKLKAVEDDEERDGKGKGSRPVRPEVRRPSARRGEPRRRDGKLTVVEALDGGRDERTRSLASVQRARAKERQKSLRQMAESTKIVRDVIIPDTITVRELANRMAERSVDVIKALMRMDIMVTANQEIDTDTAELIVGEFGHSARRVSAADVEIGLKGKIDDDVNLKSRAPVVTIMGHVDHGKTSLLDALRETDVVAHEAGGITQHIGAYQVALSSGAKITFIDTPGHAAFTEMRSRGAKVTDIVVLLVAADDGVMPQTIEAIDHAKAAEVPIIIAINKMDKPEANPNRVRTDLLQHSLVCEEMGGDILSVEVSALNKLNLDKLEEAILLQSEILDLKANPDRLAEGVVIESRMEPGRGSLATVLVQRGTLRIGDIFVAGDEWGRVRALVDAHGKPITEAGPSMPVEVLGLNGTPHAGEEVAVVESEQRAREVTEFRQNKRRDVRVASGTRSTLEQMFSDIQTGKAEELPVVIKADAHGSVEALVGALDKLGTDEVSVRVLHAGVGGINESDVTLAAASKALIIGFNVRPNPQARELAKRDNAEIRYYSIIYNVTDDMRQIMSGMLSPSINENLLGYAEIREVFNITKVGKIAGCSVTEGVVKRGAMVRLLRDDVVIHEGNLSQLKRFKDDAREVQQGFECGMAFANYQDLQAGDRIECFEVEEVAREL
jgi:translation initiation factor IF-2